MANRRRHQNLSEMNRQIDAEILLSLTSQAGLINLGDYNRQIEDINELITDLSRIIIRDKYHNTDTAIRIHKNRDGFSCSVKNERIEEVLSFVNRNFDIDHRDEQFERHEFLEFVNKFKYPELEFFSRGSTFIQRNNRVVFYYQFSHFEYYSPFSNNQFLVFEAIFEMIHLIEDFEVAAESLDEYVQDYNEHRARRDEINERERLEYEREQRELEEERRRIEQERQRVEQERNEEYQRRQDLLRQGATEEGINIAERLLDFLGRS